jgi:hypothetical protein
VIQTDDLFLGAFGLARGGELVSVEVHGTNGRRVAVFRIEGPGIDDVEREFHRGPALVDLRLLKTEVVRLKNLAFRAIREEETRNAGIEGRDRAHQVSQRDRSRPR